MLPGCIDITGKRIAATGGMTTLFIPLGFWILPTLSNLMTLRSAMEKSFTAGACERRGLRFSSLSLVLLIPTKELVSASFSLLQLPGRVQELRNTGSVGGMQSVHHAAQRLALPRDGFGCFSALLGDEACTCCFKGLMLVQGLCRR